MSDALAGPAGGPAPRRTGRWVAKGARIGGLLSVPPIVAVTMADLSAGQWAGVLGFGALWGIAKNVTGRRAQATELQAADRREFPATARDVQDMSRADLQQLALREMAGPAVPQLQQERRAEIDRTFGLGQRPGPASPVQDERAGWSMTRRVGHRFGARATPYLVTTTATTGALGLQLNVLELGGMVATGMAAAVLGKASGRRSQDQLRQQTDALGIAALGAPHRQLAELKRLPRHAVERVALDLGAARARAVRPQRPRDDPKHRGNEDGRGGRSR